ncbi:MAG: hypothetical protein IKB73_07420 [Ruminococcus sp.]|nr:hypothetical protein [Ruminococcus sp.]
MQVCNDIIKMIETYGSTVTITKGNESYKRKAFIQPLKSKSDALSDMTVTMSGFRNTSTYLYIGLPDVDFNRIDDAKIESNGKEYVVHTSEIFEFCDKALYVWAVLKPKKDMRSDDFETD